MATVGEAVIRIVGDSAAFDRSLDNLAKSGERIGARLGRSVGRAMRIGLVAAAGGAAAAIGVTLTKGFKRFTTIEDATASLTLLLGDAAKAAKLLDDTLKVVEGTPFALDQFVDASRTLVAASVPLEKVPRILEAIADGAAAAGGSAGDVDNVVNALSRLATGAELTLGPIRDLEEQGVPALRILANAAGKSTTDMAKDISAGTVASGKAIDDLVEGIINGTDGINGATVAFGGAAKNVGNTVSGAFSNMQTAVARAGARFIKVFADSGQGGKGLVTVINRLRETIDILGDAGVRLAERMVGSDGFARVLAFFDTLPAIVETSLSRIDRLGFRGAIAEAFAFDFGNLGQRFLEGLIAAFDRIPHDDVTRILVSFIITGIAGIAGAAPEIVAAVVKAAPAIIRGVIEGLYQAARNDPLNFAILIGALGLPGVGGALAGFFGALPFGFIVKPLITGLTRAITAGIGAIGLKGAFSALAGKVAIGLVTLASSGAIAAGVTAALAVIAGIALGVIIHLLTERFLPGVNRALEAFGGAVFDFFAELPGRITRFIGDLDWRSIGDIFGTILLNVFLGGPRLIAGAIARWGPAAVGAIIETFREVPGAFVDVLIAIRDAIVNTGREIPAAFVGVFVDAFAALQRFGAAIFDIGANLIDSLWQGIQRGWDLLLEAVKGIWNGLVDSVKRFFGIGSPSTVFMALGRDIIAGLLQGLQDAVGGVLDFFAGLPGRIFGAFGDLGGKMYDLGVAALEGIKRGASAVASGWGGFWSNIGARAYDAVANAIDSRSPAKKFMPLGASMIDGIVVGARDALPSLDAALATIAPPSVGALGGQMRGGDGLSARPAAAGVTQNITIESVQDLGADVERVLARLAVG